MSIKIRYQLCELIFGDYIIKKVSLIRLTLGSNAGATITIRPMQACSTSTTTLVMPTATTRSASFSETMM